MGAGSAGAASFAGSGRRPGVVALAGDGAKVADGGGHTLAGPFWAAARDGDTFESTLPTLRRGPVLLKLILGFDAATRGLGPLMLGLPPRSRGFRPAEAAAGFTEAWPAWRVPVPMASTDDSHDVSAVAFSLDAGVDIEEAGAAFDPDDVDVEAGAAFDAAGWGRVEDAVAFAGERAPAATGDGSGDALAPGTEDAPHLCAILELTDAGAAAVVLRRFWRKL